MLAGPQRYCIWVMVVVGAILTVRGAKQHKVRSVLGAGGNCQLTPDAAETRAQKTPGTNGFKILIKSHPITPHEPNALEPDGYVPGEYYTIVLEGWRTQYTVQTFRGFALAAVSENAASLDQPMGAFQVKDSETVRWSPQCYHAVSHTSLHPKTHVEIVWQAPSLTVGDCVKFRAMILEYKDLWYAEEGLLIKKFCRAEGEFKAAAAPEECCACDEAKYEMTMTGYWSKETHPKDFPTLEHLTHFSDVVGASHSDRYTMWAEGTYATEGMKQLAEWGDTTKYEEEIKDKGREIRTLVKVRGLWYPNVRGTTKAVFTTDRYHHLFSAASMLGPTPDWVVGVSSLNLCLKNCTWLDEMSFNLTPWDAGTDGGISYMSPNNPTIPRDKIKPITTKDPADQRAPFYNPNLDEIPALGKLVIKKQKTISMQCKDMSEYAQASEQETNSETSEDLEYKDRRECMVTNWTPWSICSASCGKGLRMRSRLYKNPAKARMGDCKRQMNEKQFCNAEISVCAGSEAFNDMCTTTDWAEWTECTVTCGKGLRSRSRNYNNPMAMKKCDAELMQKEMCIGQGGPDCNVQIDPVCRTTFWSEWSPCSQSCGDGTRTRTRLFFFPEKRDRCPNTELMERSSCNVQSCEIYLIRNAQEICQQTLEAGSCQGVFPRYYYDGAMKTCKRFIYTGCRGNKNNFESEDHCKTACMRKRGDNDVDEDQDTHLNNVLAQQGNQDGPNNDDDGIMVHCMVTEWSLWSECTSTCNSGHKQRTRMVKVPAKNGGHPCPRDLVQKARCRLRPCPADCRMTQWTEWSACSAPCGQETPGHQMRMRRGRSYAKTNAGYNKNGASSNCPLTQVDKRVCQARC